MKRGAPKFLPLQVGTGKCLRRALSLALALAALAALTWPGFTGVTRLASAQDQASTKPATPDLGAAVNFAVFSSRGVASTGDSQVTGDVGVSSEAAVIGLQPEAVKGKIFNGKSLVRTQKDEGEWQALETSNDNVAARAKDDLAGAYRSIAALPAIELDGAELGGRTLTPGVYHIPGAAQLTGRLTLDAQNDPGALFILKIDDALTTAEGSTITLVNGAEAGNVYFQVGESAKLGEGSEFRGNVLARNSVSMQRGATLNGRALALDGEVALTGAIIIVPCGFLEICKAADTSGGAVTGTFTFTIGGQIVARVSPGFCSLPILVPAGNILIREEPMAGFSLVNVDAHSLPAPGQNRLLGTNLAAGLAAVTVTSNSASNQTVATFTNRRVEERGTLKICKAGGQGVTGNFDFTFGPMGGATSTRSIPTNECILDGTFPVGTVINIAEAARAGFEVADIQVSDNRAVPGSRNLANRSISVTIGAGVTEVVFINRVATPTTGFLQVCKNGNISADAGPFTFNVAGHSVNVLPGFCSLPIELPAGNATITEVARDGFALADVAAGTFPMPGQNRLVSSNLAAGTATVTIAPGGASNQTIAVFTNRRVETQRGTLKICKVGGPGVTGNFGFTFGPMGGGTSTVSIPTNECFIDGTFPVGTVINIAEGARAGFEVADIQVSDNRAVPGSRNLAARTISAVIGAGVTEVVFINRVVAPSTGFLQVCKNGTISAASGPFTFTIAGRSFNVTPGFCTPPIELPVGNVTITEAARSGFALADVFAGSLPLPGENRLVSSNLAAGTATVRIEGGGVSNETVAIFTNRPVVAQTGTLKICKLGTTSAVTGSFSFTFGPVGGAPSMADIPVGACFIDGTYPVGTVVSVTEAARTGFEVADIQVSDNRAVHGSENLSARTVRATIGPGATEVLFINRRTP